MVHLATSPDSPVTSEQIATAQDIPLHFLGAILGELRAAGLVRSRRGSRGGYRLARPPEETSLAEVIRAVEGPLATVRGLPPEELRYPAGAGALQDVWVAVRAVLRDVLEGTTLADVADGSLPSVVRARADDPASWEPTWRRGGVGAGS
jgi:Rrf2 family protein